MTEDQHLHQPPEVTEYYALQSEVRRIRERIKTLTAAVYAYIGSLSKPQIKGTDGTLQLRQVTTYGQHSYATLCQLLQQLFDDGVMGPTT